MNWYNDPKTEDDELIEDKNKPSYWFVGHYNPNLSEDKQPKTVLWLFNKGNVEVLGPFSATKNKMDQDHARYWGKDLADSNFRGRYEVGTGRMSVVVPYQYHNVPQFLIDNLKSSFSPISKIYVY